MKLVFSLAVLVAAFVVLALLMTASPDVASSLPQEKPRATFQNRSAEWWARRAVQARRDANARGRTIRRLKRELARGYVPWYWLAVGLCESGLRWSYDGNSGFDGGIQFHPQTWSAYRLPNYPAYAHQASPFQQMVVGEMVLARQGWRAWPACSRELGFR